MEQQVYDFPLDAAESFEDKQYYVVDLDENGKACVGGSGEISIGFAQNHPKINEALTIRRLGMSKAISDGSVTIGLPLKTASGKVTDVTAIKDRIVAIAMESSSEDGEEISVLCESGFYAGA
jgi:hypothetical protein